MELLLTEEKIQLSSSPKFFMGQTEITPTEWKKSLDLMLKVCTEKRCEPNVFCLAIHYLKMCLISMGVHIKRNQLQLFAFVCLNLASKLTDMAPIQLCCLRVYNHVYNHYSITEEDMNVCEDQILSKMNWKLKKVITPLTFHTRLLKMLSLPNKKVEELSKRTEKIINRSQYDFKIICRKPSQIAAAAIIMVYEKTEPELSDARKKLQDLINVDSTTFFYVFNELYEAIENWKQNRARQQ